MPSPPLSPVTLTGARARLAPLQVGHSAELFVLAQRPGIWTYMPSPMASQEDARAWAQTALAAQERGIEQPFVIEDQRSGKLVGSTRFLDYDRANRGIEI